VFAAFTVLAVAGFWLTLHEGLPGLFVAQIGFGFLFALVMGTEPAMLAELFRRRYRLSGYSVSFNIGIGLAGGTAPAIATLLIVLTGNPLAPAWYLMLGGLVSAAAVFFMTDRSREKLR
jgi:MHS family proline/betaine transporter-like MFS transporter